MQKAREMQVRSPGVGNGTPLQYCCLENPMDRGAWQTTVQEVAKSRARLSTHALTLQLKKLTQGHVQKIGSEQYGTKRKTPIHTLKRVQGF